MTGLQAQIERDMQFNKCYMSIAHEIAKLSRCEKRKVGAVIVNGRNIVGFGYNGPVSGMPNIHEDDAEATEWTKDIHAEMNAILKAGLLTHGSDIYITVFPCKACTVMMAQAGIKRVFYSEDHKTDNRVEAYGMSCIKL